MSTETTGRTAEQGVTRETLHENDWVSLMVVRKPGAGVNGYVYSRETRCQGRIVAILPYRDAGAGREYLVKSEMTPCWGFDQVLSAITGGWEDGDIEDDAVREMLEETGYAITREELIPLGESFASKSADTVYSLFSVNLAGRVAGEATGDGTRLESESAAIWVDASTLATLRDPQLAVMCMRLAATCEPADAPAPEPLEDQIVGDQETIGGTAGLVQAMLGSGEISQEAAAKILNSLRGSGLVIAAAAAPGSPQEPAGTPASDDKRREAATVLVSTGPRTSPVPGEAVDAALAADTAYHGTARERVWVSPSRGQVRAMLEAAAPLIRQDERERIRQLAIEHGAVWCERRPCTCIRLGSAPTIHPFAGLLGEPPRDLEAIGAGPLLDPDCRDGKHTSCIGAPCECPCHKTSSDKEGQSRAE